MCRTNDVVFCRTYSPVDKCYVINHPVVSQASTRPGESDDDFFAENVISILFSCFAASQSCPSSHFVSRVVLSGNATHFNRKKKIYKKLSNFPPIIKRRSQCWGWEKKKCLFLQGRGWPSGTSVIPWPEISPLNFFPSLTLVKMVMGKSTHFYPFFFFPFTSFP